MKGDANCLSGFAECVGIAYSVDRLLDSATLSRFGLELGSEGSGFFDAAVQLVEQDRHVMWDLRSHRPSLTYRSPIQGAVQNKTWFGC